MLERIPAQPQQFQQVGVLSAYFEEISCFFAGICMIFR